MDGKVYTLRADYIATLQHEADILRKHYYKPNAGATGHYNTAISVLEERIAELKNHAERN